MKLCFHFRCKNEVTRGYIHNQYKHYMYFCDVHEPYGHKFGDGTVYVSDIRKMNDEKYLVSLVLES